MERQGNTLWKFVLEIIEVRQPRNQQVSPLDYGCLISSNSPLSHEYNLLSLHLYSLPLRYKGLCYQDPKPYTCTFIWQRIDRIIFFHLVSRVGDRVLPQHHLEIPTKAGSAWMLICHFITTWECSCMLRQIPFIRNNWVL